MYDLPKKPITAFRRYSPRSDLHLVTDVKKDIKNSFDIDFNFMKQGYPYLSKKTNDELITYIKELEFSELFFHSKQLVNIFDDQIKLKLYNGNIYVDYKDNDYILREFIKLIGEFTYDDYKNTLLHKIDNNNFKSSEFLLLLFIGDVEIGISLLKKFTFYKEKYSCQFGICIRKSIYNKSEDFQRINDFLKNININYLLYVCNELGNDITPTLLMYDDIVNNYHFDYIIKLHTKKDNEIRNRTTNALLSTSLDKIKFKINNPNKSACYGCSKYYVNINDDTLNKKLYEEYKDIICFDHFLAGTFFASNFLTMDNVVVFMKANYFNIFIQNMYDNNQINKNYSYAHFMERLFGLIDNRRPLVVA